MKQKFVHKAKRALDFVKSFFLVAVVAFIIRTYGYGLYQVPSESMESTMLVGERFFADKFTRLFSDPKHNEIIAFNDPKFNYSSNPIVNWFQMHVYGPNNITKRVIACPGDEIKGIVQNGKAYVYLKKKDESDFKLLNETYTNKYPLIAVCPNNSINNRNFEYRSFDPTKDFEQQDLYKFTNQEIKNGFDAAKSLGQSPVLFPETPSSYDNYHAKLDENHYWVMGDNRQASGDSRCYFGPLHKKFIHGKIKYRIVSLDSNDSWWFVKLVKHPIEFFKCIRRDRCFQRVV